MRDIDIQNTLEFCDEILQDVDYVPAGNEEYAESIADVVYNIMEAIERTNKIRSQQIQLLHTVRAKLDSLLEENV